MEVRNVVLSFAINPKKDADLVTWWYETAMSNAINRSVVMRAALRRYLRNETAEQTFHAQLTRLEQRIEQLLREGTGAPAATPTPQAAPSPFAKMKGTGWE